MRILVKYDVVRWAFHRRARAYQENCPDTWQIDIAANGEAINTVEPYDGVLLLDATASSEKHFYHGSNPKIVRMIASHTWLHDADLGDWRTRGVNESRSMHRAKDLVKDCNAVAVYNSSQEKFFKELHPRIVLAPYSVERRDFYGPDPAREFHYGRRLRVGWCYQVGGGLNSFKGLAELLVQVIAIVGDRVEWSVFTPDAKTGFSTDDLRSYYQSLDIFLCTSMGEGGPHGPFEAAACGCAIISTDVGQVSDWKVLREKDLIVPTFGGPEEARAIAEVMARRILTFASNREHLESCSKALAQSIRDEYDASSNARSQMLQMFS